VHSRLKIDARSRGKAGRIRMELTKEGLNGLLLWEDCSTVVHFTRAMDLETAIMRARIGGGNDADLLAVASLVAPKHRMEYDRIDCGSQNSKFYDDWEDSSV
jgi:hypothetical protein